MPSTLSSGQVPALLTQSESSAKMKRKHTDVVLLNYSMTIPALITTLGKISSSVMSMCKLLREVTCCCSKIVINYFLFDIMGYVVDPSIQIM